MDIPTVLEQKDGTRVKVAGFIVAADGHPPLLCEEILESLPPQCGGGAVELIGLDTSRIANLQRHGDTSWTTRPVTVEGIVSNGKLRIADGA